MGSGETTTTIWLAACAVVVTSSEGVPISLATYCELASRSAPASRHPGGLLGERLWVSGSDI